MQFLTLTAVFFSLAAMPQLLGATSLEVRGQGGDGGSGGSGGGGGDQCFICPGDILAIPKCCSTVLVGLVGISCIDPSPNPPTSSTSFKAGCASSGREAACCAVPVAGQALVCDALN
ncbi:Hydrophobin [Mycena sanguinolenta]|uniref:Hydrophobin n=1 Tax=Mycena sanguinolenta TaxID=230812 RepID=A0A8H6YYC7_9AGAR|nr:Hydrophobin [Mycena sanguinolenta]